jgi:hypothetical protein
MVAKLMNMTISPMVVSPLHQNSQVPTTKIASRVIVVEARVSDGHDRPPRQHRHLRAEQPLDHHLRSPITSASIRAKLCTSATLPSASDARSARSE